MDARVKRIGGGEGKESDFPPEPEERGELPIGRAKKNEEVNTEREINDTYRDMPWVDGQLRRGEKTREKGMESRASRI